MDSSRRKVLRGAGGFAVMTLAMAAGLVKPGTARAMTWNKAAFDTKSFADAVKALGGPPAVESRDVVLEGPDIAENGAVVPFTITSRVPGTESIAVLIEKNPNTLAANFAIPKGTDPFVNTRVKLAESSKVYALVKADGKYYYAAKEVKVTIGGCGG
jgi:sulfur-oxidizing protein SoxY